MRKVLLYCLLAAPVVGLMVLLLLWDPNAPARRAGSAAKWEYTVVTFSGTEEQMTKQLNELAGEGWEYVGLVATPHPEPGSDRSRQSGTVRREGSVALKRPKSR